MSPSPPEPPAEKTETQGGERTPGQETDESVQPSPEGDRTHAGTKGDGTSNKGDQGETKWENLTKLVRENSPVVEAWSAAIITMFTGLLFTVSMCQWGVSRDAADAARISADAATASAAAWMVVAGAEAQLLEWTEDKRAEVDVTDLCPKTTSMAVGSAHVVNVGQTPAVGWENTWETAFAPGSSDTVRPTFNGCPSTHRTQPGGATTNEYRDVVMWRCLSEAEREAMVAKDGRVYFHLCVAYEDVFGRPHTTEHAFLFPQWDTDPAQRRVANWARYCTVR